MKHVGLAFLTVVTALLVSCTDVVPGMKTETSPDANAGSGSADQLLDQSILALASTYGSEFTKVNANPYQSAIGTFFINNYVVGDVASYESIHPEAASTVSALGIGTVVVREVLANNGSVAKLTIIAKGPSGYDPSLGDWWFAETDPAGVPLVADGVPQVGRMDSCHSCHVPRATEDFLFGVPLGDMAPPVN